MRVLFLGAAFLLAGLGASLAQQQGYAWHLPSGIAPPPVPTSNPMSAAKVDLGRRLFYDADLSRDGTTSCGTCHEQHRAFTEGNATHPGVGNVPGRRNVMALANVAYFDPLTWADPGQKRLEDQVLVPLMGEHPVEMGMGGMDAELSRRLSDDPCYRQMFAAAFPGEKGRIDRSTVAMAIASFERTLISYGSPYDLSQQGNAGALSAAASRGKTVFFGAGRCGDCHAGNNFTDGKFHNIGLYNIDGAGGYPARDHGLKEMTGEAKDEGAIRTPSLRNVALTSPYMHDGSVKSLSEAIRRHLDGSSALRDPRLSNIRLNDGHVSDLAAFLQSLTDQGFVTNPDFALPKIACSKPL